MADHDRDHNPEPEPQIAILARIKAVLEPGGNSSDRDAINQIREILNPPRTPITREAVRAKMETRSHVQGVPNEVRQTGQRGEL